MCPVVPIRPATDDRLTIERPFPCRRHRTHCVLQAEKHAVDVDVHHALEVFQRALREQRRGFYAALLTRNVELAEGFHRRRDGRFPLRLAGDVVLLEFRLAAGLP